MYIYINIIERDLGEFRCWILDTYILFYDSHSLLTYSMVQSPSWEANWFAASQEIPRISRNPKVHYRTHKLPPTVSILGQPNPVHIPTSYLLEIHPNIIHPSTPRSPQWSPSLRLPHQDFIHPPLLTHTRYMPSSSHSSRFYQPYKPEIILTIPRYNHWQCLGCCSKFCAVMKVVIVFPFSRTITFFPRDCKNHITCHSRGRPE